MTAGMAALVRGQREIADFLAVHEPHAVTPFQTGGWWRAWAREAAEAEAATPLLLRVPAADGDLVVGLQVHHDGPSNTLRPLSWPWADYHEAARIDCPPDDSEARSDRPASLRALAEGIDQVRRALGTRLDLTDLVADGLLHQACSLLGAVSRRSATVVQLDLRQPETLRWMTGRGEIRRKRQRLGRAGDLHLTCADTPERLTARLPAFIRLHSQQWRDRPHAVAPFDGGVVDRTFAAVAAEASSGAQLHELWLDDTLLAGYFGFLSGRTYFAYRTAYESRYRRDSPGHLLVSAMVEQLVAQGADTFDLMRGAYTYKLDLPGYVAHTVTAELA